MTSNITTFQIASAITTVESYELKTVACHDAIEETIDLHQKWFAAPDGAHGTCLDKHGKGSF